MYDLYVKAVSVSAGCASTAMMLTPLLVCKDIVNKKSSDHINASTFIGSIFRSSLFVRQSFLLDLPTIMVVHVMGLVVNTCYLSLYWNYSSKKKNVMVLIFKTTLLSIALLTYSFLESKDLILTRFPTMVSVIHLSLIGWPLLSVRQTIKMKQWSGHPKPILINTIVLCILWLLYSMNIQNSIIFIQCSIALLLSSVQLVLSVIYPNEKIQNIKIEKHE